MSINATVPTTLILVDTEVLLNLLTTPRRSVILIKSEGIAVIREKDSILRPPQLTLQISTIFIVEPIYSL